MDSQVGHVWLSVSIVAHAVVTDVEDIEVFEFEECEHDELELCCFGTDALAGKACSATSIALHSLQQDLATTSLSSLKEAHILRQEHLSLQTISVLSSLERHA